MDLMRLSPQMAAIQNIKPRVALLWSNAAQVHDKRFFNFLYRVYEALNFCGIPIAFVTDEQLVAEGAKDYACILATGTQNIHGDAAQALREFQRRGGRIVGFGEDNLTQNQYGLPLEPIAVDAVINSSASGEALRDQLLPELSKAGIKPEILVRDTDGSVNYGVEWRSASIDDTTLLNVVNLTRHEVEILLPEGNWHDLIRGVDVGSTVRLESNQPHLLQRNGD